MVDQERVDRARENLESAIAGGAVSDPAVRIVKLNPPIAGGLPVSLNRKLTMLSGLSRSGTRTLFATIDGMQRDRNQIGQQLDDGEIAIDHGDDRVAQRLAIIESCEQALLLSGAEMRGADLALADIEQKIAAAQDNPDASSEIEQVLNVSPEFEPFINNALEAPSAAQSIEDALEALSQDARRIALKAACSLDLQQVDTSNGSNAGMRLFGSSNRSQTSLIKAEAEGELSEYDMTPGSPAYVLASRLDQVEIPTSPLDAAEVATKLLAELDEAKQEQAEYELSMSNLTGSAVALVAERETTAARRASAARRVSTQQHLRQIARSQLSEHGTRRRGLMPVLIEEPFDALPHDLTSTTLAMLLEHAEIAQVILVTSRSDVRRWCHAMDDRVGYVEATGWFAEEHEEW